MALASILGFGGYGALRGFLRLAEVGPGRLEAVSVSGDVEIALRPGVAAAVNLSTVSGSTDSDLPISDRLGGADRAPDGAETSTAEPDLDLRVTTTSGDIGLRRAVTV